MKEMRCIHPRTMVNEMRKFVLQACDLEFEAFTVDYFQHWIEDHNYQAEPTYFPCDVKIKRTGHFQAFINEFEEDDDSIVVIGYNFKELPYVRDYFTTNFRNRCTLAKGFAGVTLALLHELGHFETNIECHDNYPDWDRTVADKNIREKYAATNNLKAANDEYFTWPDENLATEWAMHWLQDAEHRKIAKDFEKKFFACFTAE